MHLYFKRAKASEVLLGDPTYHRERLAQQLGAVMDAEDVRREVRAWLEANWNPELSLVEWRNRLADSGWAAPTWPERWLGRGLPVALGDVVAEEFERIGAVGTPTVAA